MGSNLLVGTAVIASLLGLSACDNRDTTVSRSDKERVAVAPAQPAAPNAVGTTTTTAHGPLPNKLPNNGRAELTSETRGYVQKAAMGDMVEVEASRLALSRSSAPEIKQFAQHMVDAHTQTTDELKARLVRAGLIVELPTMLDDEHKKMLDELRSSNGREFDGKYIDLQKKAHDEALMIHRDYAMHGTVADFKAFAADTVPKIEMHVQMAADLQNKMRTRVSNAAKR